MDANAKRELATAIRKTHELREASYDGNYRYRLSYQEAASQACDDPDVAALVAAMLGSGFADFPDWSDQILAKQAA